MFPEFQHEVEPGLRLSIRPDWIRRGVVKDDLSPQGRPVRTGRVLDVRAVTDDSILARADVVYYEDGDLVMIRPRSAYILLDEYPAWLRGMAAIAKTADLIRAHDPRLERGKGDRDL